MKRFWNWLLIKLRLRKPFDPWDGLVRWWPLEDDDTQMKRTTECH